MVEVFYTSNNFKRFETVEQLEGTTQDLMSVQLVDYTQQDLSYLAERFQLDFSLFTGGDDIEISSHYRESPTQLAFHLSIPYFVSTSELDEEQIYYIIKENTIFSFLKASVERRVSPVSYIKSAKNSVSIQSYEELLLIIIGNVSDYYADLTELISKRIKTLAERILKAKQFIDNDLDLITEMNMTNILVKESMTEFQRILILLKRNRILRDEIGKQINYELSDLTVIGEHVQYNFDRLDDLKENLTSKIDLEQNKIFKILTIITVCISLPTLIAGIYGMNFQEMPELHYQYGYPVALILMVLSFTAPLVYFKWKKWF